MVGEGVDLLTFETNITIAITKITTKKPQAISFSDGVQSVESPSLACLLLFAADDTGADGAPSSADDPCLLACSLACCPDVGSTGGRPSDLSLPSANTEIA